VPEPPPPDPAAGPGGAPRAEAGAAIRTEAGRGSAAGGPDPTATPGGVARPYVIASCAVSVDGFIDDTSAARLILSGADDLDRVDEVRAGVDAILVGATTVRRDDPALLVRSAARRAERSARGLPDSPRRVVLTATGDLDPGRRLWFAGDPPLVYCPDPVLPRLTAVLRGRAEVVGTGAVVSPAGVLADLAGRGIGRLLVEGGESVHTQFLAAGLVDEIQLAVAPVLVGERGGPRFVGAGRFPPARMRVAEVRQVGDVALIRLLPGQR
jgi:5-amino-6-(5-phosphoribosylamino)uracil reductase